MKGADSVSDPQTDIPRLDGFDDWNPDDVVGAAVEEFDPVARFCLLSGGNDSTVLAHRCAEHYDELVHIDTGTAVPGVREYVDDFACWLGKPLRVLESGDAFRVLILGDRDTTPLGFPGPASHLIAYTRLKERQVEALIRDAKRGHSRRAKIMLISGTRRHESARRMRTQATRYRARKAQLWTNPLLDWTDAQMAQYRRDHRLPASDVVALLHRSGECNCGSFAAPGEREMLASLWPKWFDATIGSLEREAERAGLAACRWGERPQGGLAIHNGRRIEQPELCSDCPVRL